MSDDFFSGFEEINDEPIPLQISVPEWVEQGNDTLKLLYKVVTEKVAEFDAEIESNAKNIKAGDITIRQAKIAELANGLNRSSLKRHPKIQKLIKDENERLVKKFKAAAKGKITSGTKPTRIELQAKVSQLAKESKNSRQVQYRSLLEELRDDELLPETKELLQRFNKLQAEYGAALKDVAELKVSLDTAESEKVNLRGKVFKLEQQLRQSSIKIKGDGYG